MNEILELLDRKAVFHCRSRSDGLQQCDMNVFHTCERLPESTELPDWLPPSMHSVLTSVGTMVLFHPECGPDEGFRLYSPEECIRNLAIFRKIVADAQTSAACDDDVKTDENKAWRDGLCPIAEVMGSGDYFALDTESAQDSDECPIVYLDHEYYFSGWLHAEDVETVANDVTTLVRRVLEDPLRFLDAYWIGGNPYEQWFPESVSFSE